MYKRQYIEFEYDRIYDPVKQYTYPKRASIGRVDPENQNRMTPNENFLKYFPDADIPEEIDRSERSPYLNIGPYVVLQKLIRDSKLREILGEYMDEKDTFHLSAARPMAYSHGRYYGLGECLGTFGYSVKKTAEKRGSGKGKAAPEAGNSSGRQKAGIKAGRGAGRQRPGTRQGKAVGRPQSGPPGIRK